MFQLVPNKDLERSTLCSIISHFLTARRRNQKGFSRGSDETTPHKSFFSSLSILDFHLLRVGVEHMPRDERGFTAHAAQRKWQEDRGVQGEQEQREMDVTWPPTAPCGALYLCTWEAASSCRSPNSGSFRRPPWRSRQNTSMRPRPRTGRPPPAPTRGPRGGGGHRRPLDNSPHGTTRQLLTQPRNVF